MASERSVPTRTYIAFSIAAIFAAWVLASAQALMNPIPGTEFMLHAWALIMTNPLGVATLINAVAAASLLLFQWLVGFVLGGMQGDEAAVCRRRALSFFFYKLAMTGFVLDLALDLDTLTMSPWLASLVLVVALTAVARRRRERLSPQRFSWATHGASVIFTLVVMAVNTAVLLFWASMLLDGGISLALLLLVDCFLEGLSLAHALARTAIEAYDAWVSPESPASAGPDGEGAEGGAVQGWQGKVAATLLVDFVADAGGLVLTLVHYLHVWWTAGFNFSLLDVLLFLNCRAVVIQLRDRYSEHLEFYRRSDSLRAALAAMHVPTEREIRDEDAVCGLRVPLAVPPPADAIGAGSPFLWHGNQGGLGFTMGFGGELPGNFAQAIFGNFAGGIGAQAAAVGAGGRLGALPANVVRERVLQVLEIAPNVSPRAVEAAVLRGLAPAVIVDDSFARPEAWPRARDGELEAYMRAGEPAEPPQQQQAAAPGRADQPAAMANAQANSSAPPSAGSAAAASGPALPLPPGDEPKLPEGARGFAAAMDVMRRRSQWLVATARYNMATRDAKPPVVIGAIASAAASATAPAQPRETPESNQPVSAPAAEPPASAPAAPVAPAENDAPVRMSMAELRRRRLAALMRTRDGDE